MLTLIINTYNEADNIVECVNSANDLADEIIVCDMNSDDNTVELAKSLGAKLVMHKKEMVVEPARFFAISQATHEWVFVIDADERLNSNAILEIRKVINEAAHDLIYVWCKNIYFGKALEYGGFYSALPRCFKKELYLSSYNDNESFPHQNFYAIRRAAKSPITFPKTVFFTHLAYPTIEKYITKTIGFYAKTESLIAYNNGMRSSILRLTMLPVKVFLKRFFYLKGYKDGRIGFIVCILYSLYLFVKEAHLILMQSASLSNLKS